MSTGQHARVREGEHRRTLIVGLVVLALLVAALVTWRALANNAADDCEDAASATVVVAPDLAPAMEEAATAMADEGWCARIDIEARPSAEVFAALVSGDDGLDAEMWIPDSDHWLELLAADRVNPRVLVQAVATTPVVLVGGPSARAPETWFAALSSGQVTMSDPQQDASSALALVAPRAESETTGVSPEEISGRLVPAAQKYGERKVAEPPTVAELLEQVTTTTKQLVPTTEQAWLAARRTNRDLTAVVPESGTLVQRHPLVALEQEPGRAADELVDFLSRPQGALVMSGHGFRAADGAPLDDGVGLGDIDQLTRPDPDEVAADLRMWDVLTVPSSILAVVDASGSMDFRVQGAGTRMELAMNAAGTALDAFPSTARVGLWLFSIDQGGPGIDHRELVPLRRLDEEVDGTTQREALQPWLTEALDLTAGGTGLYDTALAAFRSAQADFDPDYFNAVVLLTDGANEDPDSIGLDDLLTTLRNESDPGRPVRIIAIGISEDADMEALEQIAEATGGSAYAALDPRDILEVMSQALLAR